MRSELRMRPMMRANVVLTMVSVQRVDATRVWPMASAPDLVGPQRRLMGDVGGGRTSWSGSFV